MPRPHIRFNKFSTLTIPLHSCCIFLILLLLLTTYSTSITTVTTQQDQPPPTKSTNSIPINDKLQSISTSPTSTLIHQQGQTTPPTTPHYNHQFYFAPCKPIAHNTGKFSLFLVRCPLTLTFQTNPQITHKSIHSQIHSQNAIPNTIQSLTQFSIRPIPTTVVTSDVSYTEASLYYYNSNNSYKNPYQLFFLYDDDDEEKPPLEVNWSGNVTLHDATKDPPNEQITFRIKFELGTDLPISMISIAAIKITLQFQTTNEFIEMEYIIDTFHFSRALPVIQAVPPISLLKIPHLSPRTFLERKDQRFNSSQTRQGRFHFHDTEGFYMALSETMDLRPLNFTNQFYEISFTIHPPFELVEHIEPIQDIFNYYQADKLGRYGLVDLEPESKYLYKLKQMKPFCIMNSKWLILINENSLHQHGFNITLDLNYLFPYPSYIGSLTLTCYHFYVQSTVQSHHGKNASYDHPPFLFSVAYFLRDETDDIQSKQQQQQHIQQQNQYTPFHQHNFIHSSLTISTLPQSSFSSHLFPSSTTRKRRVGQDHVYMTYEHDAKLLYNATLPPLMACIGIGGGDSTGLFIRCLHSNIRHTNPYQFSLSIYPVANEAEYHYTFRNTGYVIYSQLPTYNLYENVFFSHAYNGRWYKYEDDDNINYNIDDSNNIYSDGDNDATDGIGIQSIGSNGFQFNHNDNNAHNNNNQNIKSIDDIQDNEDEFNIPNQHITLSRKQLLQLKQLKIHTLYQHHQQIDDILTKFDQNDITEDDMNIEIDSYIVQLQTKLLSLQQQFITRPKSNQPQQSQQHQSNHTNSTINIQSTHISNQNTSTSTSTPSSRSTVQQSKIQLNLSGARQRDPFKQFNTRFHLDHTFRHRLSLSHTSTKFIIEKVDFTSYDLTDIQVPIYTKTDPFQHEHEYFRRRTHRYRLLKRWDPFVPTVIDIFIPFQLNGEKPPLPPIIGYHDRTNNLNQPLPAEDPILPFNLDEDNNQYEIDMEDVKPYVLNEIPLQINTDRTNIVPISVIDYQPYLLNSKPKNNKVDLTVLDLDVWETGFRFTMDTQSFNTTTTPSLYFYFPSRWFLFNININDWLYHLQQRNNIPHLKFDTNKNIILNIPQDPIYTNYVQDWNSKSWRCYSSIGQIIQEFDLFVITNDLRPNFNDVDDDIMFFDRPDGSHYNNTTTTTNNNNDTDTNTNIKDHSDPDDDINPDQIYVDGIVLRHLELIGANFLTIQCDNLKLVHNPINSSKQHQHLIRLAEIKRGLTYAERTWNQITSPVSIMVDNNNFSVLTSTRIEFAGDHFRIDGVNWRIPTLIMVIIVSICSCIFISWFFVTRFKPIIQLTSYETNLALRHYMRNHENIQQESIMKLKYPHIDDIDDNDDNDQDDTIDDMNQEYGEEIGTLYQRSGKSNTTLS